MKPIHISKLRDAIKRLDEQAATGAPVAHAAFSVGAGNIEQLYADVLQDAKEVYRDDEVGDPLSAYYACVKSLCNTTGGKWVDDDPNRLAGCYFPTKVQAAGYAALVWSCLPGGFLKWVLG